MVIFSQQLSVLLLRQIYIFKKVVSCCGRATADFIKASVTGRILCSSNLMSVCAF